MNSRKGEKWGWLGGWLGSFVWVIALAGVFMFQQKWLEVGIGIAIVLLAAVFIFMLAPWRNPDSPMWKLLSPIYGVCNLGYLELWRPGGYWPELVEPDGHLPHSYPSVHSG